MQREYDDQILRDYFKVSVMDVVAALMAKIELQYSTDYEPEVMDGGEEAIDGADFGD